MQIFCNISGTDFCCPANNSAQTDRHGKVYTVTRISLSETLFSLRLVWDNRKKARMEECILTWQHSALHDGLKIKQRLSFCLLRQIISLCRSSFYTNSFSWGRIKIWRCCTILQAPTLKRSSDVSRDWLCWNFSNRNKCERSLNSTVFCLTSAALRETAAAEGGSSLLQL